MKKYLLSLMAIVIAVQLLVPSYMIWNKYNIIRTGEEFKFAVAPVDPYDAFRGRYVSLWIEGESARGEGRYGKVAVDENGYAYIEEISEVKPSAGAYLKSKNKNYFRVPIDRYYMDEKIAPVAESMSNEFGDELEAYVTVKVKNGEPVVTGLFTGDRAIEEVAEEILKQQNVRQ